MTNEWVTLLTRFGDYGTPATARCGSRQIGESGEQFPEPCASIGHDEHPVKCGGYRRRSPAPQSSTKQWHASSAGDGGRSPPTLLLSRRWIPSCESRQHELMVRWSWSSCIFTRPGSGHIAFGWQNPSGFHGSFANPSEPKGRGAPARAGPPVIDLEQRRWAASTWKRLTWVAHMAMAVTSRERKSDWHRGSMRRRSGAGNVDADLGQFGPKTIQWRLNSFSFLFLFFIFYSIFFSKLKYSNQNSILNFKFPNPII